MRAVRGAQPAFEAFYRDQHAPMVRLARLLTGSVAVAEDLTQDAFVGIAPRLSSLDRPEAYLRTMVVNACRSHHRHEAVKARVASSQEAEAERRDPPVPSHLVELDDALAALPERQRAAIVLRYYADLPEGEIAELLGCRPTTVRSLVARGMAALREVIEP
jgi:RNA polymerase sigma-70 factor (sigma-E family)